MSATAQDTTNAAPAPTTEAVGGAAPIAAVVDVPAETPLTKLAARLPEIIAAASHNEMWGVELGDATQHVPTKVVLQKFLRANNNDAAAAEKQLASALEWRKKMQPGALVKKAFDKKKFDGLGYVTVHKDGEAAKETVITWNVYGAVKSFKVTFGDLEEFIQWRTALMELGVQKLNLNSVTEPIADGAEDPYQMVQVHDYLSVSFLRMDPNVKAASSETIKVFSTAYPELLAHKYFVNVPAIMGWMYSAMKLFLAPATLKKFHPMRSGTSLAGELPAITGNLPKEYGGQGESIQTQGICIALADGESDTTLAGDGQAPVAADAADSGAAPTVNANAATTTGVTIEEPADNATPETKAEATAEKTDVSEKKETA